MNTHAATLTFSGSLDEVFKAAQRIGGVLNVNVAPGQIICERTAPCSPQSSSEPSRPTQSSPQSASSSSQDSGQDSSQAEHTKPTSADDDPTDAQLESLLSRKPELRPVRPSGAILHHGALCWHWRSGGSNYPVEDLYARALITVRMLERLPPMSTFIPPIHAVKTWTAWVDEGDRFDGPTPLAALYAYWSAQP